jgi:hypothetical protein
MRSLDPLDSLCLAVALAIFGVGFPLLCLALAGAGGG